MGKQKSIQISREEIIQTLKSLLQTAIELEHATIPAYLYTYWTITDRSSPAARVIFSIVKEEMLHLAIAANILNAIGGRPRLRGRNFMPKYPAVLPGHDQTDDPFRVHLDKCSAASIANFLHIELPRKYVNVPPKHQGWASIAEFYLGIIHLIRQLKNEDFRHGRQAGQKDAPSESGQLITVRSKDDALRAIHEIIEQGEGLGLTKKDDLGELAHFFRLEEIYRSMGGTAAIDPKKFDEGLIASSIDKVVYQNFQKGIINVIKDPGQHNPQRIEVSVANLKFNSEYSKVLDKLHYQFRRENPDLEYTINSMFALARNARSLMSIPVDPNDDSKGFCGPTFSYLYPRERLMKYDLPE
jgi:hypothetical protein